MALKNKKNVFETALIEKRNILNEIRNNNMTLQELRFFSIYLSKINARDPSTRVVSFSLDDFQKIMGIGSDMNIPHFRTTIRKILQEVVEVPNENGNGYTAFQLFKEAVVRKNEYEQWIVEFDAHDKALPLMFDFKKNYFTYELWNALRLKSANQIRMYEILKQYEKIGYRELTVQDLKALLGIAPNEYPRWNNFKTRVLDSCQQALKENTDICYTYEKGHSGRGGAWVSVIFHIYKNTEYVDQLTLSEFIDLQATGLDEADITNNTHETPEMIKTTAKIVSETVKEENTELIDKITAEVDECIEYEGMRKLEEAVGGKYKKEKLELLETIRNIIIQVIAGDMSVRINKQVIPKEYAKEVFSHINYNDVSNVICKFLEYPDNIAKPQALLATMLFNEVNGNITQYMQSVIRCDTTNADTILAIQEIEKLKKDPNKKVFRSFSEALEELDNDE